MRPNPSGRVPRPRTAGQSSIEFLTLFAFAIALTLVALGALVYFGVVDLGRFIPNSCSLRAGIACTDARLNATALTFSLYNAYGRDLDWINVSVSLPDGRCDDSRSFDELPQEMSTGPFDLCVGAPFLEREKGRLTVRFSFANEQVVHTNDGTFRLLRE